jgi:hypothetical protein
MNACATVAPPEAPGGQVLDFTQRHLERALRERVRYRYVQAQVLREGEAFRIEAPCCSRNVDPEGGVIDIALLTPLGEGQWRLQARDHAAGQWQPFSETGPLDLLLDLLCVDELRIYWP